MSGWGFSDDLDFRVQSRAGTTFELVVMDAFGRMYWHDIRSAVWQLDNAAIRYDANFNRDAFITGLDSRINHTQDIPTKYRVAITQQIAGPWSALFSDDRLEGYHFPELGLRYGPNEHNAAVTFDIRTRAIGLNVRWHAVSVALLTNRLQVSEATALGTSLRINYNW